MTGSSDGTSTPRAALARAAILFGWLMAGSAAQAEPSRTVVDMAGRTVRLPPQVNRVACFEVLCYEKFFLLGGRSRVAAMYRTEPPWMSRIDPDVTQVPKVENAPNREELLKERIDVVFLRYDRLQLRGLEAAGLPAVVSQPPLRTQFAEAATFVNTQKQMVRLFAEVLGGDAAERAERWCAYYDERLKYLAARIDAIPPAKRLKAYYLRGPNAVNTQGPNSNTYWYGVIGGADMIVKNLKVDGQGPMSLEEIVSLDPDFIFVGRQYKPELVLDDPKWRGISAVKNHHVVPLPEGMFYWDGSTEGILLAELVAKTLYPETFGDLNMAAEIRSYFKTFYDVDFSDDEIGKFLRGQTPAGIRRGY